MSSAGVPSIASIAGPLILGFCFNISLYGVLCAQTYVYYIAFPNDRWHIKVLVYATFILETSQTIVVFQDAFTIFGSGFGDTAVIGEVHHLWFIAPVMSAIVSCPVQLYYTYRIYSLSKSKLLCLIIASVSFLQFGGGFYSGLAHRTLPLAELAEVIFVPVTIWLVGSAVCDVIIAVTMTYILLNMKNKAMPSTSAILTRIVRLVVETGALTAATAIVDLALFLAFRNLPYHICSAVTLAKLYSNSLLVLLNSRSHIEGGRNPVITSYTTNTMTEMVVNNTSLNVDPTVRRGKTKSVEFAALRRGQSNVSDSDSKTYFGGLMPSDIPLEVKVKKTVITDSDLESD